MKLKHHALAGSAVLSLLALSACVNDDYDLSDIDTTVHLQTKELTVPINLDYLTLDQVMDLDDDSEIVKDVDENGNPIYAVKKEGTFNSSTIKVDPFTVAKPSITPTSNTLALTPPAAGSPTGLLGYYIIINVDPTDINTSASDIDEAIQQMDVLSVTSKFTTVLEVSTTGGTAIDWSSADITGLQIKMPKGLVGTPAKGTFEPANSSHPDYSLLDFSGEAPLPLSSDGKLTIQMDVTGIEAINNQAGTPPATPAANMNFYYDDHSFTLSDEVEILAGQVNVYSSSTLLTPPASVTFTLRPEMDAIDVSAFTGRLKYDVEDFDIEPIDLSNLPDFLSQTGTVLGLEKPQIYLGLNNPVGDINNGTGGYMFLETGFKMTPERTSDEGTVVAEPCVLDNGTFTVPGNGNTDEQYFVMAPTPSSYNYPGYTNPTHVPFTQLKDVLTKTDGIPTKIAVEAVNPQLPNQPVQDFLLDNELPAVEGKYAFYAPLQLTNSSIIMYTDTIDGWNDEDVDAINITEMLVNFDLTSEVPFSLDLDIVPITLHGKPIDCEHNTVEIGPSATDFPVAVTIKAKENSPITHLDGLLIKAKVHNPQEDTLGPEMKLYLKNSKATVTGYYEKEL